MQNGPTTPRRVSMILDASTPRSGAANPQPYSPAPRLKIGTPDQSSFATELFHQLFLNGHSLIARSLGDRIGSTDFNPIEAYEFLINVRTQYQITLDSVAYNKLLIGSREMFKSLPATAIGDFWFFQLHQMTKRITLDLISMSSDIQKALQDPTLFDKQNTAILNDWGRSTVYLRHNENWTTSNPSQIHLYEHIDTFLAPIDYPTPKHDPAALEDSEIRRRVAYFVTQEGAIWLSSPMGLRSFK